LSQRRGFFGQNESIRAFSGKPEVDGGASNLRDRPKSDIFRIEHVRSIDEIVEEQMEMASADLIATSRRMVPSRFPASS
jgi:hypothetical protein